LGEKENQSQRTVGSGFFKKLQRIGSFLKRTGNEPVVVQLGTLDFSQIF
jgi:hypothetical protein